MKSRIKCRPSKFRTVRLEPQTIGFEPTLRLKTGGAFLNPLKFFETATGLEGYELDVGPRSVLRPFFEPNG